MSDMTITEAAKAVAKSPVTIRAAVNQGKLKSQMRGRTHYVNLNDVVALFVQRSHRAPRAGATAIADQTPSIVSVLEARIQSLESERDHLRQLLESERNEKSEIMKSLLQRTAEIQAFLSSKPGLFKFFGK
jgi:hypothetical protein